jgi:hypothetical protein
MYKVIGADQKEYGPITADQLRQWITQNRVNSQTKVQVEGSAEWKLLADIPEFAEALRSRVPPAPAAAPVAPAKTSGMAIASLVLGILGFVTCGLTVLITSPLGLILGLVSMNKIKKSQGQLGGQGLALAGTIVSGVSLVMLPFLAAMMLPALARAKQRAQTVQCGSNIKALAWAVRMYADDHNNQFPPATNWCDAIRQEVAMPKVFQCPAARSDARCHYAFNARLSGLEEGKVAPETVMIFECEGGWNVSGGPELALTKPRHGRVVFVALADGSVQQVTENRLKQLRWEP